MNQDQIEKCSLPAGVGPMGRGHCPLSHKTARRGVAAYAALRDQRPEKPRGRRLAPESLGWNQTFTVSLPLDPATFEKVDETFESRSDGKVLPACRGGAYGGRSDAPGLWHIQPFIDRDCIPVGHARDIVTCRTRLVRILQNLLVFLRKLLRMCRKIGV